MALAQRVDNHRQVLARRRHIFHHYQVGNVLRVAHHAVERHRVEQPVAYTRFALVGARFVDIIFVGGGIVLYANLKHIFGTVAIV